jgi:hypothetical protein
VREDSWIVGMLAPPARRCVRPRASRASTGKPSRLCDEAAREGVSFFEVAACELRRALIERRFELDPFLGGQVLIVWEQHFDRRTFGELNLLVQHDLTVVDMSSERLH